MPQAVAFERYSVELAKEPREVGSESEGVIGSKPHPPTLQEALRDPRTQAGSTVPCYATPYELIPSQIEPVLQL